MKKTNLTIKCFCIVTIIGTLGCANNYWDGHIPDREVSFSEVRHNVHSGIDVLTVRERCGEPERMFQDEHGNEVLEYVVPLGDVIVQQMNTSDRTGKKVLASFLVTVSNNIIVAVEPNSYVYIR